IESAHSSLAAQPSAASPTMVSLPPAPTDLPASLRPRAVEVPDYLRAGAWWRSTGAIVGLAAILLIGISIVFATGLRGWLGGKPSAEPLTAQNATTPQNPAPVNESASTTAPPQLE